MSEATGKTGATGRQPGQPDSQQLVTVDTATGQEVRRTPGLSPLEIRNDRLLAFDGSQSRLVGPDGTDVLREADQKMLLRWLDDDTPVYLQGHRPDDQASSDFATISAQNGSHTLTMPVGRSSQCSYTGDRLACAEEEATRIWDISR